MGKSTIIGILVGFGALIVAFMMEKGNLLSLLLPSPAVTVFGGTAGALLISFALSDVASIPKLIGEACKNPPIALSETLDELLNYATMAKREGLLVLEKVIEDEKFKNGHNPLIHRGLSLLMDGLDRDTLKAVLESEIYIFEQQRKREISIFEAAAGFAPTMGVIGTVMGLVQVLSNMGAPEELAASISVAFIATFYGVCFANLLFMPIANKLKLRLKTMIVEKEMIIEGLLSINELENPMVIKEKLSPFLAMQKGAKAVELKEEPKSGKAA